MKRFATDSMFYRLFGSFLLVILLLVVFIGVAFVFFLDTIKDEITKNSRLNLNATVRNYEEHFEQIRSLGLSLLFNDQVSLLSKDPELRMDTAVAVRDQLSSSIGSPSLYVSNLILYMKTNGYAIEKDSAANAKQLFGKLFYSKDYPLSFWQSEMGKKSSFAVYPATTYWQDSLGTASDRGSYIPILIKRVNDSSTAVLAFMNVAQAYRDFSLADQSQPFGIVDAGGRILYASSSLSLPEGLLAKHDRAGYALVDGRYYFYQKGGQSGFTYVSVIPNERVNEQLLRLTALLAVLLAIAVLIGIGVSAWISRRLNAPVRHLADWIGSVKGGPPSSSIREFRLIGDKLSSIQQDMNRKNSLLNLYAYADRMKMIDRLSEHFQPLDKPYRLVLFHLAPADLASAKREGGLAQATGLFRDYIGGRLASSYPDAVTLQLEQDEILTVLYAEEGEVPALEPLLQDILNALASDSRAPLITTAVSSVYDAVDDISRAYAQVSELALQRRLGAEPQLITERREPPQAFAFSHQEDKEFDLNLVEGNEEVVLPMLGRALARLQRKGAYAYQYEAFARELVNRIMKMLFTHHIDPGKLSGIASPYEEAKVCHTFEQYAELLESLLARGCQLVREKKSENDPITSFVMKYIEDHYAEDISLDMMADRLNITRGYLSTYFKEKSGTNFVDYVMTYRMDKAKEILSRTDLKIQEVGQLVGYANVSTFIRVFKKQTGTTPGDYKKLNAG
ncbi:helix-turn-helix transcriptional regulator [Cohnella hashimotonis]|uniref:Helix-turn-helix domain-containing protein n=1 Tax=Cohnella hashimotonis TaxID=2826895 RepID=A0ABT6TS04_9BACL|nr:helix-turn-helix domain-containing protein [Cohnella hashimotonis]